MPNSGVQLADRALNPITRNPRHPRRLPPTQGVCSPRTLQARRAGRGTDDQAVQAPVSRAHGLGLGARRRPSLGGGGGDDDAGQRELRRGERKSRIGGLLKIPISISATGRFVAYSDNAPDLVEGDRNFRYDVFVRDRMRGETTRVSVSSAGAEANDDSGISIDLRQRALRRLRVFGLQPGPGRPKPSLRCLRPRSKAGQDDAG